MWAEKGIAVLEKSPTSFAGCLRLSCLIMLTVIPFAFILALQNSIMDRFNPFSIDFTVEVVQDPVPIENGNPATLADFSTVPVVSTSGTSSLIVSDRGKLFRTL
jgi:hypothetical protein